MKKILWTFERVARFSDHPDLPVRRWAMHRLLQLFPERAAPVLAGLLDEDNFYLLREAAECLGRSGERERYGPLLLEHLQRTRDEYVGYFSLPLGMLNYRPALPPLLERLQDFSQDPIRMGPWGQYPFFQALGLFGGNEVRQALWETWDQFPPDQLGRPNASLALLEAALPQDVHRFLQFYQSREGRRNSQQHLRALARTAGAADLHYIIGKSLSLGLEEILHRASWYAGERPALSKNCLNAMSLSCRRKLYGLPEILHNEARRILSNRGDDLDTWQAAWESGLRLRGYKRRTLLTTFVLQALAQRPGRTPRRRQEEAALGLALLVQLGLDRDDQAWLDAADDRTEALLDILCANRQHVLPDIVEEVVALGPGIVEPLIERIDPTDYGWSTLRLALALEALARRYPGICDRAIPLLIELIDVERGDADLEAAHNALVAIGPVAVPALVAHLRDEDSTRQIYLTGALSEIPTEASAQALLAWIEDGLPHDEMQYLALMDIGSTSAIEPLYALWQQEPEDTNLVEALLVLCQLHGVEKAELDAWRQTLQEQETRWRKKSRADFEIYMDQVLPE